MVGNKQARAEIAMIKVAAPAMACKVIDWAIQAYGGGGTNNDVGLASAYATARLLRLADGPDEIHRNQIARIELAKREGRRAVAAAPWPRRRRHDGSAALRSRGAGRLHAAQRAGLLRGPRDRALPGGGSPTPPTC